MATQFPSPPDATTTTKGKIRLSGDLGGTANAPTVLNVPAGSVVQVVNVQTSTLATGATVIPYDNTIPQNTEGNEYMTLSITPKSATNILIIDVIANLGLPGVVQNIAGALFQDSGANALAVSSIANPTTASVSSMMPLKHKMTAGTTSATTFRFRAGVQSSGTLTFNGIGGAAFFGGVYASSITITEIRV